MTHLQKIIAEAKKMRKAHPKKFAKWTDYVSAASKKVKPTKNKKIVDYHVNKSKFIEKRAATSPRKRPIKKAIKEFAVTRTTAGQFKKVKRIAGVGAIQTSVKKMANDLAKELTKIQADAKKIPQMKRQLTKLKKAIK